MSETVDAATRIVLLRRVAEETSQIRACPGIRPGIRETREYWALGLPKNQGNFICRGLTRSNAVKARAAAIPPAMLEKAGGRLKPMGA